uniref:Putative secreted protein n=1 Tax=Anopheles darlingi TaxID=43151 RepID=A0A2M4D9K1_ANODA
MTRAGHRKGFFVCVLCVCVCVCVVTQPHLTVSERARITLTGTGTSQPLIARDILHHTHPCPWPMVPHPSCARFVSQIGDLIAHLASGRFHPCLRCYSFHRVRQQIVSYFKLASTITCFANAGQRMWKWTRSRVSVHCTTGSGTGASTKLRRVKH